MACPGIDYTLTEAIWAAIRVTEFVVMPKIGLADAVRGTEGRLTRAEAAQYLGMAQSTLADWHRRGIGPESVKVGGRRFYRLSALQAFISKQ